MIIKQGMVIIEVKYTLFKHTRQRLVLSFTATLAHIKLHLPSLKNYLITASNIFQIQ